MADALLPLTVTDADSRTHRMSDLQSDPDSAALVWSWLRYQLRRATVRW